ncbi:MAG: glycosyltransferase family 39 protein [Chloroflexi bacterium]|nr:glycosyltransferase family 39 protein [Chloroflexota bacterium]
MNKKALIIDSVLLILFFILLFSVQAYWLSENTSFLPADMDLHLGKLYGFYEKVSGEQGGDGLKMALARRPREYPPVLYLTGSLSYLIFGTQEKLACLSVGVFSLILIFAVYGTGLALGGRGLAWMAVLITTTSPQWFTGGVTFRHEAPLTAFLALCFLFYFLSDGFRRRREAVLCGIFAGMAALSKFSFVFFLILPLLYWMETIWLAGKDGLKGQFRRGSLIIAGFLVLAGIIAMIRIIGPWVFRQWLYTGLVLWAIFLGALTWAVVRWEKRLPGEDPVNRRFNLLYAFLAFLLLGFPHYAINLGEFSARAGSHLMTGAHLGGFDLPAMLLFYLKSINDFFPGALALLVLGTILSFIPAINEKRGETLILLLSIAGGVFFLAAFAVLRLPYYILPALPAVALLSIFWAGRLKPCLRGAALALVILLSLWQLTGWLFQYRAQGIFLHIPIATAPLPQHDRVEPYPERADFPLEKELLEAIRVDCPSAQPSEIIRVLVKRNFDSPLAPPYMRYLADKKHYFHLDLILNFNQEIQRDDMKGWHYLILMEREDSQRMIPHLDSLMMKETGKPPALIKELHNRRRGVSYITRLYRYPFEDRRREHSDGDRFVW